MELKGLIGEMLNIAGKHGNTEVVNEMLERLVEKRG